MADLYEVHTTWTGVAGSPYYTTHRGLLTGPVTPSQFATAWLAFLETMKGAMDDNLVAVVEPEVTIIDSTTGQLVGVTTIAGGTKSMTGSGDVLPPQTQALVQVATPNIVNGRRLRGRFFLPGMMEANNAVDGKPSAALTSAIGSALATFVTAVSGGWVIYSPTNHVYAVVSGAQAWNQWAVLRSRRD